MSDTILASFLARQYEEITELAAHSDVVEILQHGPVPPDHYILRFHCRGLIKTRAGVAEADWFDVGLRFPEDYLRRVSVPEIVTWLWPPNTYHPNVLPPYVCLGRVRPGTALRDLVYQLYEIITYHKVVMREDDALNHEACAWARQHQEKFPLETRPLRRRALTLRVRAPQEVDHGPGS
jgi:hypothetical protein